MSTEPRGPKKGTQKPSGDKYAFMKKAKDAHGRTFDISRIDSELLRDAIQSVIENGDLISFTLTSDSGAICITVISGTDRNKAYASDTAGLADILGALSI